MSHHPLFSIYKRLPVRVQSHACWLYGYNFARRTYNKDYYQKLEWLKESERWSTSEIEAYQNEELRKLIKEAYENVHYYRELMDRLKLKPSDVRNIYDLPKLPILKKEDIRNNLEKFVSKKTNKRDMLFRHTSGTTGKSLHFYTNKETETLQWAIWWRHRNRFGMTNDSQHVNFRAQLLTPADQEKPPFWRWVTPMKQVVINMAHLIPSKIEYIVDFLNQNYFEFYTANPSFIHILCATAIEKGLQLTTPPRIIFMGAENTLDFQKRCIEEFTGALITDQYGSMEGCANASQCENGLYHEDFELGAIECVDPESLSNGRYKGRIIGTGFKCHGFPFVRYEIGDIGTWQDPALKCQCGRHSKTMLGIEGREDDYVLTPEGRRISRFDWIFDDAQNCIEAQVVQEELGKIKVFIVRRAAYSSKDEKYILRQARKWISNSLEIEFVYVPEIERGPNGKFRLVKSVLRPPLNNEIPEICGRS